LVSALRASATRFASATLVLFVAALACAAPALAAPTGSVTELPLPNTGAEPEGIAPGPDGNMWVAEFKANAIARVTPAGTVTEFFLPAPESGPTAIVMGPDGNMWFTEAGSEKRRGRGETIGRITTSGTISEFKTLSRESGPEDITLGPDGNLWFTEGSRDRVGRITTAGVVSEFPTPSERSTGGITSGPDGNLWFTEPGANNIGMITPTGTVHEYAIPLEKPEIEKKEEDTQPEDITAGLDGNVWFTEARVRKIGKITPAGAISQYTLPAEGGAPNGIAPGQDGNVWFTQSSALVGRITPNGEVTRLLTPTAESEPFDLAPGVGGDLWVTEQGKGRLALVASGGPAAVAQPPAITGAGVAGNLQVCNSSWASWGLLQPSFTLFPFDGYRWYLDGALIATGQSYTPTFAQLGHALSCSETITYAAPFLVTTSATSAPVTVNEPPPTVTAAAQSAAVWRSGPLPAAIARRRHRAPTLPPVGTKFTFVLNEPATVTLSFTQALPGRRVGRTCVAKNRRKRHRACVRTVTVGVVALAGHPGLNTVVFDGRLSARSSLRPGRYTMLIGATNAGGVAAAPAVLRFTVAPSPRRPGRHHR
jgi:streptogramin lyase